jgi:tRNA (guanine-N7-)-methyltransferase
MNIQLKKKILNIKTYSNRYRKLTKKKKEFMNSLWPLIGLNIQKKLFKIKNIFNKNIPIILEIGFGSGECLINFSRLYKKIHFLGVEVYVPGICTCLKNIYKNNINNVHIFHLDAISFLKNYAKDIFFYKINIFFPDPWPKRRHHKRRMIQKKTVNIFLKKLIINGILHIVTDCFSYATNIIKILDCNKKFQVLSKVFRSYYLNKYNFYTRFRKKANIERRKIYEIIYQRIS